MTQPDTKTIWLKGVEYEVDMYTSANHLPTQRRMVNVQCYEVEPPAAKSLYDEWMTEVCTLSPTGHGIRFLCDAIEALEKRVAELEGKLRAKEFLAGISSGPDCYVKSSCDNSKTRPVKDES